jgi:cysteine desulfurase
MQQKQLINFDNNATTKVADEVLKKMIETYEFSLNPSSTHALGRKANMIVEAARMDLQDALNAANYEVFFTSGGTEANNMALFGDDYDAILFAKIEHSSIYNTRPKGADIIELEVDENGVIKIDDLSAKIAKLQGNNFLVSVMYANSENGAIQPIKEIAQIVHQKGGLMHSDMVQACGKIEIDLEDLNVDFACISAHKINGPQGNGAIFVRRGLDIKPLIYGGGQESGKRSGTQNVAGIAGFGLAAQMIKEKVQKVKKLSEIRDFIEDEVKKIAGDDVLIFAKNVARTPNTSFIALRGANGQTQMIHFDLAQIMVSAGSACSSGSVKPSRVLEAMNVSKEFLSPVRVSLGLDNTMDEAKKFVEVFKNFYDKIKK